MKCPHLDELYIPVSGAKIRACGKADDYYGRGYYIPSSLQVQAYCQRNCHNKCPFYQRISGEGIKMPMSVSKGERIQGI